MTSSVEGLDWDDGNTAKYQQHGKTIAEIVSLFARSISVIPDPLHSRAEERFKAVGTTDRGRFVFLVFTLRRQGEVLIRPISARYMHRKEIEHYEKEAAKAQSR